MNEEQARALVNALTSEQKLALWCFLVSIEEDRNTKAEQGGETL